MFGGTKRWDLRQLLCVYKRDFLGLSVCFCRLTTSHLVPTPPTLGGIECFQCAPLNQDTNVVKCAYTCCQKEPWTQTASFHHSSSSREASELISKSQNASIVSIVSVLKLLPPPTPTQLSTVGGVLQDYKETFFCIMRHSDALKHKTRCICTFAWWLLDLTSRRTRGQR